jgi:hypothetical protein
MPRLLQCSDVGEGKHSLGHVSALPIVGIVLMVLALAIRPVEPGSVFQA